jgi:hypothetical protein
VSARRLIDLECLDIANQITEFGKSVCARIEVWRKIVKLLTDLPQRHPSVFAIHLGDDSPEDARCMVERL